MDDAVRLGTDGVFPEEFRPEEVGEHGGGGAVEDERSRDVDADGGPKPCLQPEPGEGVETKALKGPGRVDRIDVGVAQHGGGVAADQFQHRLVLLGFRQGGQSCGIGIVRNFARLGHRALIQAARVGRTSVVHPKASVLECVGRQIDPSGRGAVEQGRPGHWNTPDIQPGESRRQRDGLVPSPVQRGDEHVRVGPVSECLLSQEGENAARTQLKERRDVLLAQRRYSVEEPDGLADVVDPVIRRAELFGCGQRAGEVGDDWDGGRQERQPGCDLTEPAEHAVHVRGVEGVTDPQPPGLVPSGRKFGGDGRDRLGVTGEDHRCRPVDRGDGDGIGPGGHERQDLALRRVDGDHRPVPGQGLHQPGARRHKRRRVLQRQHSRRVRGGQLADGVPREKVGTDSPGLVQAIERRFHREEGSLGEYSGVEQSGIVRAGSREHHVTKRKIHVLGQVTVEGSAQGVERGAEHGILLIQFPAHAHALAALTGEQERESTRPLDAPGDGLGEDVTAGQSVQASENPVSVRAHDNGTVLEDRASGDQRVRDVDVAQLRPPADEGGQPGCLAA